MRNVSIMNIPFNLRTLVISLLLVVLIVVSRLAIYFHDAYNNTQKSLKLANETIVDLSRRQFEVAALDTKLSGELADAKNKLANLQRCVVAGKCGLRVNVISKTASATSMDVQPAPDLLTPLKGIISLSGSE
ncbi:TPA: lysis system i-spanin subunit Rz [Serratia liquefaciens]